MHKKYLLKVNPIKRTKKMSKRIITTGFLIFILLSSGVYGVTHKIFGSASVLIRNSYISQISTLNTNDNWYAVNIDNWELRNTPLGIGIALGYEATFKNNFFLRVSTGIESTGDFMWPIDIGGGIKLNIKNGVKLSIGVYFATVQTGGKLGIVPNILGTVGKNPPEEISYYMGMFGFKGRVAIEIPLNRKMTISPFLSYAAYPHTAHNIISDLDTDIYINNLAQGLRLDGIQIGAEFSFLL